MSSATWITFLTVATAIVMAVALFGAIRTRQRDQLVVPFVATLLISCVLYSTMVDGAGSLHSAIIACTLFAITISALLIRFQPWRSKLATISWAMLGVVTPYAVFFIFLTAACAGKSECLG